MAGTERWDGPLVFVDVDTQRDFLEPGGTLYLSGSDRVLGNLGRLTALARERGIPVIATACAHAVDEEDPEPFPAHCLVGTRGQERVEATAWEGGDVLGPGETFVAGEDAPVPAHLTIEKRRYDVFSHPEAARLFEWYDRRLGGATFVVYGVATDYCVACAARGLLGRGHRVLVVADAVHAVDPAGESGVLTELVGAGAVLTVVEEVERRLGGPGGAVGMSAGPVGG